VRNDAWHRLQTRDRHARHTLGIASESSAW
jgi:hypothetical protein